MNPLAIVLYAMLGTVIAFGWLSMICFIILALIAAIKEVLDVADAGR